MNIFGRRLNAVSRSSEIQWEVGGKAGNLTLGRLDVGYMKCVQGSVNGQNPGDYIFGLRARGDSSQASGGEASVAKGFQDG
jgi:hypothetical protein